MYNVMYGGTVVGGQATVLLPLPSCLLMCPDNSTLRTAMYNVMYGGTVVGGQAAVLLPLPSCLLSVSRQFYPDSDGNVWWT